MKHPILALMILALAVPVGADDEGYDAGPQRDTVYAPAARVRYVERSVTLQHAGDSSEEAQANVPFLPGDRLSTDDNGRAELQLESGTVLRVDIQSTLEYPSDGNQAALRLDGGGLYVHARERGDLTIDTPGGLVTADGQGVFRIDADSGETRLSVFQGSALLDSGGRQVEVGAGERTYANNGQPPEDPQGFNRGDQDDFARWDRDRDSRIAYNVRGDSAQYLPTEIASYASDLDGHGNWDYDPEAGHVWRPYVNEDWSPYSDGRWEWTDYGWNWCPYESWGWAPFHYGRWGFTGRLGWYWIPGRVWGPAWVSWAYGGDYVGWCPLGFYDRPVVSIGIFGGRFGRNAWFYARSGDILSGEFARRRVSASPNVISALRVASPGLQPTRDFRAVHAMPTPTARLRGQAAPLGSHAVIRGTAPNAGAVSRNNAPALSRPRVTPQNSAIHPTDQQGSRSVTPNNRAFSGTTPPSLARPRVTPQNSAVHPTDQRGSRSVTPNNRAFSGTTPPSLSRPRVSPQNSAVHPTDQRGSRGSVSEPYSRVVPRAQNRPTDTFRGSTSRSPADHSLNSSPSSAWRRNDTAPRRSPTTDGGWTHPSAPRSVERAVPQPPANSGSSRNFQEGTPNRSFQPPRQPSFQAPRQQPMPRSEAVRPQRMDSAPRYSAPHNSAPHSVERSAPRPAPAQRDRHHEGH